MKSHTFGSSTLYLADCLAWLEQREPESIHGVVTDPPYGLKEYEPDELKKLREGNGGVGHGGVWRLPPTLDGSTRSPLPRFTVLSDGELDTLKRFFYEWGQVLYPTLTPGAHVLVASNPLLQHHVTSALDAAGYEPRGLVIRLTQTLRGGDRPKGAHRRYDEVTVMPKSAWEPWILVRKPISERTVALNLDRWGTGGLRRLPDGPFRDVLKNGPTRRPEKEVAPHPSLKPQALMRQLVRAILPLSKGIVLDPFAGSGSTLAAAEVVGYDAIGVEMDSEYFRLATEWVPKLIEYGNVPTPAGEQVVLSFTGA